MHSIMPLAPPRTAPSLGPIKASSYVSGFGASSGPGGVGGDRGITLDRMAWASAPSGQDTTSRRNHQGFGRYQAHQGSMPAFALAPDRPGPPSPAQRPRTEGTGALPHDRSHAHMRTVPVLGAQFRGRTAPRVDTKQNKSTAELTCPNCTALSSKLHRARNESSDARREAEEATASAERENRRVRDLEEQLARFRQLHLDELASARSELDITRGREREAAARLEAMAAARAAAAPSASSDAARQAAEARAAAAEAEALKLRGEVRESVAAVEDARGIAEGLRTRLERSEAAVAAAVRSRDAMSAELAEVRAAATEAAARRAREEAEAVAEAARQRAEASAAAERVAAEGAAEAAGTAAALASARGARDRSELEARAAADDLARSRDAWAEEKRSLREEIASLQSQCAELEAALTALKEQTALRSAHASKLGAALARAEAGEQERNARDEARRGRDDAAEAEASALRARVAELEDETARTVAAHAEALAEQTQRVSTLRDLMGAIKIAVLAPCVKLHINGVEPALAGSPGQVRSSTASLSPRLA